MYPNLKQLFPGRSVENAHFVTALLVRVERLGSLLMEQRSHLRLSPSILDSSG